MKHRRRNGNNGREREGGSAHSTAEFSLHRNGMSIVTAVPVVYDVMKPRGLRGERLLRAVRAS